MCLLGFLCIYFISISFNYASDSPVCYPLSCFRSSRRENFFKIWLHCCGIPLAPLLLFCRFVDIIKMKLHFPFSIVVYQGNIWIRDDSSLCILRFSIMEIEAFILTTLSILCSYGASDIRYNHSGTEQCFYKNSLLPYPIPCYICSEPGSR